MVLLVDSAVIIDLMRDGKDPRQELLPHLRACELYNCGVVRAEVMRGMKVPRMKTEMEAFFDIIPEVPCDAKMWRQVSELGWKLGRKGKWPPLTDLLIASCAMRVGATLISPDRHFEDMESEGLMLRKSL